MDCNCQGDKKSSTDSFFGVEHFEKYLEKIKQQRASNSISTDETKFSNLCPIDNLSINSMNSDNLKINNEKQQQPDDTCASEFRASEITLTPRNEASDSVKQFIKFKQNIQNTLMNFNDEMSSALRNSIGDINQICSKVRSCLSEMEQFDPKCPKREVVSTPDLSVGTPTRASAPDITLDSLKTPIITQSENQIRVVLSNVLPEETPQVENTTNGPVQNRPQSEEARTPTEKEGKLVLKEIISMHEEIKQCLDTMKEEVDKISEAHRLEYEQHMERIMQEVEAKKRESKKDDKEAKKKAVVEKVQKRIKEQEIRQRQFDDMKSQQSHTLSIPPGLESSVTRSRGLFDIHAKLVNQMHACDSLCEFERKMLKNPELRKQRKLKKARENREKALAKREREKERDKNPHLKYKDSLWFSNMHGKKNKQKKRYKDRMALHKTTSQTSDRSKNSVQSHDSTKSVCSTTCHCSTHCSCKVIVERSRPTTPRYNEKSRTGWMAFQSYNHLHSNKKLNCVDILDELTEKDVEPIRSEYPRKDDVIIDKHEFVENTFLYDMVYGKGNQKMLELLSTAVPPRIQCSASKCIKCQQKMKHYSDEKKPKKGHKKEVKKDRPPLPKKDDIAAKLRPYIFDPHLRYRTTITVMPVTVYVDRSPLIESKKPPINLVETGSNTSSSSASYLYTAGDFSRKPPIDMQVRTRQINERKLWTNKYGKTVGQHLVSFIEKQPALSDEVKKCKTIEEKRMEDRPKNGKTKDVEANQRQPKMNLIKPTKTMMARAPSKMSSQETCEMKQPKKRGPPSPRTIAKKAENSYNMLDNMRNLVKNHSVMFESNIQNIIEMIEKKIVDVLSKPEKQNAEAFNAVEKEIRQVLKKMRMLHGKSKKEKVDSLKMTALDTIFGYDPESPVSEEGEENIPKVDLDGATSEGTSPRLEERVSDGSQVSPGLEEQASDASQSPRAVELGSNLTSDSERCVVTAACGPDSSSKEEPVKEPRKLEINEEEVKSDASEIICLPETEPVPQYEYDVKSYNNILEFLEQITARPKEAQAQVVCHLTRNAEVQYEPIVLHQSFVQCSVEYTNVNATTSTQTKRDTVKKVKISRELPKVAMMEYGSDIEKEHKHILNAVYTTVFLVMYLALSFKFGCSSA